MIVLQGLLPEGGFEKGQQVYHAMSLFSIRRLQSVALSQMAEGLSYDLDGGCEVSVAWHP